MGAVEADDKLVRDPAVRNTILGFPHEPPRGDCLRQDVQTPATTAARQRRTAHKRHKNQVQSLRDEPLQVWQSHSIHSI